MAALTDFLTSWLPRRQSFSLDTDAGVRAVQQILIEAGYLDPPADGDFGPVTEWALRAYAERAGLDGSVIGPRLQDALRRRTALPLTPLDNLAGQIVRAMRARGYWIARHPDCVNIIYVEGMDPDGEPNDNRNNAFNDTRLLLQCNKDGVPRIIGAWEATTEPSRFWTLNPMYHGGAFHIAFGQYKSWVIGPYKNTPCLLQRRSIDGFCDPHKTFMRDKRYPLSGVFGVHHHSGYDLPHDDIGTSSAGCLVGRSTAGHAKFMAALAQDARYRATPGYTFMATVLPYSATVLPYSALEDRW